MTEHAYDPDLPYVVASEAGNALARFRYRGVAEEHAEERGLRVIDTTPKPRVPDDAEYITWVDGMGYTEFAIRTGGAWLYSSAVMPLESLPGVTPETEFTVLDERRS